MIVDRMLRRILGDKVKGKRDDAEDYSITRFKICTSHLFLKFFKNIDLNQAGVSISSATKYFIITLLVFLAKCLVVIRTFLNGARKA